MFGGVFLCDKVLKNNRDTDFFAFRSLPVLSLYLFIYLCIR
ncbi:hypothetical protein HMPREF9151_00926 [Hoylesella saccharolytica F0055]|uniref:Uncharacterized protein n=1 Tax=Hoylesella saccharolytica F0055 TaxID=1127699 RepID=L1NEU9_9BACT|nr:hypothetical protein HMPREF9151_00926 [Hoylesella saccharolytica F0055]